MRGRAPAPPTPASADQGALSSRIQEAVPLNGQFSGCEENGFVLTWVASVASPSGFVRKLRDSKPFDAGFVPGGRKRRASCFALSPGGSAVRRTCLRSFGCDFTKLPFLSLCHLSAQSSLCRIRHPLPSDFILCQETVTGFCEMLVALGVPCAVLGDPHDGDVLLPVVSRVKSPSPCRCRCPHCSSCVCFPCRPRRQPVPRALVPGTVRPQRDRPAGGVVRHDPGESMGALDPDGGRHALERLRVGSAWDAGTACVPRVTPEWAMSGEPSTALATLAHAVTRSQGDVESVFRRPHAARPRTRGFSHRCSGLPDRTDTPLGLCAFPLKRTKALHRFLIFHSAAQARGVAF